MTCRRLLLLGVSVASLNAALLSSASAATCVTDVNTGFTNVVSGVAGAPGISCGDGRNADNGSTL